ncbi:MAG: complex I NDUFA9 subunit family protein [Neomegalonema sp.]|nr:complex I NDUFA9 subunit family protein [Neomegalonema sp.]
MPLVVVFGGSGFVGRYVVQKFAKAGWRVRVAVRRPNEALSLRTYGAVGQVEPVQANIRHEGSVRAALQGADLAINLVGILTPTGKQSFEAVHDEGAGRVAALAKAMGVPRFIHMSALGADAQSESDYAQTKAAGEAAVRSAFPEAVIMRPSIVFGPEDEFFNRFAGLARYTPIMPVFAAQTRFQPVYVDDVAQAFLAAGQDGATDGQTFTLTGPRSYSFRELIDYTLEEAHRPRVKIEVPFWIARIKAWFFDLIPYVSLGFAQNTLLTRDQLRMLESDNVAPEGAPGLAALGVDAPSSIEAVVPSYLWRYRPHGQFDKSYSVETANIR